MKKLISLTVLCLIVSVSFSQTQNSYPPSGAVGLGTLTPSAKLDVNGNMIVDSCLRVKDSLLVEKDLRTKGKFIVEDDAFFLKNVFVNEDLTITGELEISDNLKVSNNAKFEGSVKMTDLAELNNLNNPNLEVVFKTPSGDLKTIEYSELKAGIGAAIYEPFACISGDISNPMWSNGLNKIFSPCPEVNVGINTSNPQHKLSVIGTVHGYKLLIGNTVAPSDALINGYVQNNIDDIIHLGKKVGSSGSVLLNFGITNSGKVYINAESDKALEINTSGNGSAIVINNGLGKAFEIFANNGNQIFELRNDGTLIWTNNNGEGIIFQDSNGDEMMKIGDDGILYSKEIIVKAPPFPDYVFSKGYNLKPLSDVKIFIEENGHLPGIPSAKSVANLGLSIGEMQVKQMEKIEDIYLYLIEMNDRINQLEKVNGELKLELSKLKSK